VPHPYFVRRPAATRRPVRLAAAATLALAAAAPAVRAETYSWVGTTGTSTTSPSGGNWNSSAGNVWATGVGATAADVNTIPTTDPTTVLSFGGSGTSTTAYTAVDNINSDLTLNQLVNANSQSGSSGAVAQSLTNTGATSARLVFVANGATGPSITNTGTANVTINIPVLMNATLTGNGASASGLTQLNALVTGTGNFVVNGGSNASRFDFAGANTFTGGATNDVTNVTMTLTRGQVLAARSSVAGAGGTIASGPFGTGTFVVNTSAGSTTLVRATTNNNFTLANPVTLGGDLTIGSNNATATTPTVLTFSGPVTITGATRTLNVMGTFLSGGVVTNGDQTFSGAVGDGGAGLGIIKAGPAVLAYSGAASNTYTGPTTVTAGVLALGKTGGATAIAGNLSVGDNSTSGNTLAARDTLLFRGSDQIADAATLLLNGALLSLSGQSEGTPAAAGLGPLTSQNASVIDTGSGTASVLHFANSSAATWSGTLQVLQWAGSPTGGSGDQILFGTSAAGLTASQLARVSFVDPAGFAAGSYAARILPTGEIVPVPEPTTVGLLAVTAGGLLARRRRRVD
jgi:autotransporter-associated beta strand protein